MRVKLLSDFTCVFEKMSAAELALETEAARSRKKQQREQSEQSDSGGPTVREWLSKGNARLKGGFYGQAHACYQRGQELALREHHCLPRKQPTRNGSSGNSSISASHSCATFKDRMACVKVYANDALAQLKRNELNGAARACNTGLHLIKRNLSSATATDGNVDGNVGPDDAADVARACAVEATVLGQWRVRILLRRASARLAAGLHESCFEDLQSVQELEPRNADAAAMRRKVALATEMLERARAGQAEPGDGEAGGDAGFAPKGSAFWKDVLSKASNPVT